MNPAVSMSLQQAAQETNAEILGSDVELSNLEFSGVSTDSRSLLRGSLFVALNGERFDGHDYIDQACQQGAVAALVSHDVDADIPQLIVEDTLQGLGHLAHAWRVRVNPKVVALTGSNGKTTLKEMLSAILSVDHQVLATHGNLNNEIGVPLTLLRLQQEALAVIEMGANHVGEIDYLSRITMPDVAVLNNAGRAHIGEFGSEENIARGKAEILNGLKAGGVFVYHGDSKWAGLWQQLASDVKSVSFGKRDSVDFQLIGGSGLCWNEQGFFNEFEIVEHGGERFVVRLPLAGEHNAMNATAAVAAARQLGISVETIKQAFEKLEPVRGRLKPQRGSNGQWLIDDAYNANPDSVEAAIEVLITAPGRRVMVLGDLAELGDDAEQMMSALGEYAAQKQVDVLFSCGINSLASHKAFVKQSGNTESRHFEKRHELIEYLLENTGEHDVLLIKGSRSAAMDKVVDALRAEAEEAVC